MNRKLKLLRQQRRDQWREPELTYREWRTLASQRGGGEEKKQTVVERLAWSESLRGYRPPDTQAF